MKIKTIFLIQGQNVTGVDPEVMAIMAKYTAGWFQSQLDVLPVGTYEPPQDWSHYTAMVDAIKAINPDFTSGMYIGGASFQRQWEPGYPAITNAMLFHKPDGSLLIYDDGAPGPPPAASRYRWFRVIDEGVRATLIAYYLGWLEDNHFDGLFIDSFAPSFYATNIRNTPQFGLSGGIQEGPAHLTDYWAQANAAWTDELTTALEAVGAKVYLNGLGLTPGYSPTDPDYDWVGDGQITIASYGTGWMFEHGHAVYKDTTTFTNSLALFSRGLEAGGEGWFQCFPLLFGPSGVPPAPVYSQDLDLARFYLATYLLVQNERSLFWYYQLTAFDPNGDTSSNGVIHWSADWDLDYGEPTGRVYSTNPETLRWREYTRGYACVNPTPNPQHFNRTGTWRVWDPEDGFLVHIDESDESTHYTLAPYSGSFLWSAA